MNQFHKTVHFQHFHSVPKRMQKTVFYLYRRYVISPLRPNSFCFFKLYSACPCHADCPLGCAECDNAVCIGQCEAIEENPDFEKVFLRVLIEWRILPLLCSAKLILILHLTNAYQIATMIQHASCSVSMTTRREWSCVHVANIVLVSPVASHLI